MYSASDLVLGTRPSRARELLISVFGVVALLLCTDGMVRIMVWGGLFPSVLLPSITTTILPELWREVWVGDAFLNIAFTATNILQGVCIGLCGYPLGLALRMNPNVAVVAEKVLSLMFATSRTAILFILVLFFGLGEESKVFISAWVVGVYLSYLTFHQAGRVLYDPLYQQERDLVLYISPTRKNLMWNLLRPRTIPQFFQGLRLGLSNCWTVAIVAEMDGFPQGVGWAFMNAYANADFVGMYVHTILITLCNLTTWVVILQIERSQCRGSENK